MRFFIQYSQHVQFGLYPSTDSGKSEASLQHELHLQERDPGGLGPSALHRQLTQGSFFFFPFVKRPTLQLIKLFTAHSRCR